MSTDLYDVTSNVSHPGSALVSFLGSVMGFPVECNHVPFNGMLPLIYIYIYIYAPYTALVTQIAQYSISYVIYLY